MENDQEVIVIDVPKAEIIKDESINYPNSDMGLGELLSHVRGLWLNPGDRISRGEYLLASLPFAIITSLIGLVVYKLLGLSVYDMVAAVLSFISAIMGIRLMVARLHDLNKSGWNVLWFVLPLGLLLLGSAVFFVRAMGAGASMNNIAELANSPYAIGLGILALLLIIGFIGIIVLGIKLIFFKGTTGDNQYGSDPLLRQSSSNTNYWILFAVGVIISLAISSGLPKTNYSTVGMGDMSTMQNTMMQDMQGTNDSMNENGDITIKTDETSTAAN